MAWISHISRFFWNNKKDKTKKQEIWWVSLLEVVGLLLLVPWLLIQHFAIPTPSMEGSLLVGDHLFVSKFHYGARTPATPLQIPLTHQKIWWTNIPSYSDWIQLPMFRLPGFSHVKNNDVVVFNWPDEKEHPVDLRTYYVKRCMGIAGDTLQVKQREVFINGKKAFSPPDLQYTYLVTTNGEVNERIFERYDIPNFDNTERPLYEFTDSTSGYMLDLKPSTAKSLLDDHVAIQIDFMSDKVKERVNQLWPFTKESESWSVDNYGPVWIPKEGSTLVLDSHTVAVYAKTISDFEGWKSVENKGSYLLIDGKKTNTYTFKQNYYFMMGDNRNNSLDSRYWGFVPADHIVGKPVLIFFSSDPQKGIFKTSRLKRIFNLID